MTMKKTETNSNETYRMTIGKTEIYGVSIQQLTDLHETIGTFIQREKAPFKYKTKSSDEYCIDIIKTISLESGEEDFSVEYSLDSFDIDMDCMSAIETDKGTIRHQLQNPLQVIFTQCRHQ